MSSEEVALIHALYRTSVKGRKDLGKALLSNEPVINVHKSYDSRVAEFFEIILKSLGFKLEFLDSDDDLVELNTDDIQWFNLENGKSAFCTEYDKYIIDRRNEIREEILEEYGMLNEEELEEMIDEEIESRQYIMGAWDGSKDFFVNCTEVTPVKREIMSTEEIDSHLKGLITEEVEL